MNEQEEVKKEDEDSDTRSNEYIMSLAEFSKLTGLSSIPVADVFEIFAESTDQNGLISREEFNNCFASIAKVTNSKFDNKDADRLLEMLDRLFDMFDTSQNDGVDYLELVSGLSVLCTWCSSAKRENFNHFTLSCFNHFTLSCFNDVVTRISPAYSFILARKSLENQRSNANSIMTKTPTPLARTTGTGRIRSTSRWTSHYDILSISLLSKK